MATMRSKQGQLEILKQEGVKKKWRMHTFKVSGSTYLLYFKTDNMNRPDGQLLLSSITKVEANSAKGADYPFEVHFRGKAMLGHSNSPWFLNASSNDERLNWMEAIKPGSSAYLKAFSSRNTLSVTEKQHYQQEYRRLQPSPPPSYPPPQLQQTADQSPGQVPESAPPTLLTASQRRSGDFDPSKSWHGRPNVYRISDVGRRTNSVPDEPEPYLEPQHLPTIPQVSAAQYNSRATVPRNFERTSKHAQTNGGPHAQFSPPNQQNSQGFARNSISHSVRNPPPKLPPRSATELDLELLDESDDPYQLMMSSPVRVAGGQGAMESPKSAMKPKPKPRPRKSPSSSPKFNSPGSSLLPVTQPVRQPTTSNEYVELCGDSGATVVEEIDGRASDSSADMMSSINKLTQAMSGGSINSLQSGDGDGVIPETLAQSFTSSQLQLLINMLQKVQSVQSPQGGGVAMGMDMGGSRRGEYLEAGSGDSGVTVRAAQGSMYEDSDPVKLKGNFKRALSYAPDLPEEQILITDNDDSYLPRPEWAKATGANTLQIYGDTSELHIDSTLTDLEEDALYISRDSLEDFKPIGEGQFGKVFKAMLKSGVEPVQVAVKTAKKSSSSKEKEEFMREMNIMSQMMHPNIVRLYGVVQQDMESPWIVLEYLRNGDLKKFLTKNKQPVKQLVKYMIDISMGMHYLAEKGLVHRDLAARNILVGENETCKVADFGLLREIPKDDSIYQMHTNVPCPVRWMPPESISQRKFSTASDVWSFGVLQWEMFNPKKMPYGNFGNMEVAIKVATGYRLPVPRNIPPVVARIMKACWHSSPEKRPSFLLISTLLTTKVTFDDYVVQ